MGEQLAAQRLLEKFREADLPFRLLTVDEVAEVLGKTKKEVRDLPVPYLPLGRGEANVRYDPRVLQLAGMIAAMPNPPEPPKPHWVYFVGYGSKVKIGSSRQPTKRFSELQCGSPVALRMLGIMDGGPRLEEELHARWSEWRTRGEWFQLVPVIKEFIKANTKQLRVGNV